MGQELEKPLQKEMRTKIIPDYKIYKSHKKETFRKNGGFLGGTVRRIKRCGRKEENIKEETK